MPGAVGFTQLVSRLEPKPSLGSTTLEPVILPWHMYPDGIGWSEVQPFGYLTVREGKGKGE